MRAIIPRIRTCIDSLALRSIDSLPCIELALTASLAHMPAWSGSSIAPATALAKAQPAQVRQRPQNNCTTKKTRQEKMSACSMAEAMDGANLLYKDIHMLKDIHIPEHLRRQVAQDAGQSVFRCARAWPSTHSAACCPARHSPSAARRAQHQTSRLITTSARGPSDTQRTRTSQNLRASH